MTSTLETPEQTAHKPRQRTLRFRLACLVSACMLPVCLLAGLFVYYSYQHKRRAVETSVLLSVRDISTTVDEELATVQGTLTSLATSPALKSGDLRAFHAQILEVLRQHPNSQIALADSTGQELLHSLVPFGQPLPKLLGDPALVRQVFATGKPVISNLLKGTLTGKPLVAVEVPVFRGEQVIYDLVLSIPAERLAADLSHSSVPSGWTLAIMDRNSVIVVRSRLPERYVGAQTSPELAKRASEIAEGTVEYVGKERAGLLVIFTRSAASGWLTAIGIPETEFSAEIWQSLKWAICGIALILAISIGAALHFARRIAGSIEALITPALALGSAEPVKLDQLDLAETVKVGQALAKASDRLQQLAVEQKRAEAELTRHRDELEVLVKQRTSQLELANAQLQADITERKRAEVALRASEAQFRSIFENSLDAMFVTKPDGKVLAVNPAACALFGMTEDELRKAGRSGIVDPDDPRHAKALEERLLSGKVRGEMNYVRKDGTRFPSEMQSVIFGQQDNRSLVVVHDITERKRAEAALRASEELWATTLQSIGDAVISTCAQGKVIFMNEVAQKLTGWPLSEAKGRHLDEIFNIVQEVTRIKPESPVAKVIRSGLVVGLANHTALIKRDGTEIPIEDSGAPVRNRDGKIDGVVLVFHDVSEQRNMQRVLRTSDRLATTGRLAATIAHEIHNPLDTVGNLLYIIRQTTKEESTRENIVMASEELSRVTQMTQRMLTFQRETSKPVPVKLGELLDSVLTLYERKIKSAAIEITKDFAVLQPILAQPGELRQVFANLLGNAIEAVGNTHGKILLRANVSRDWRNGHSGVRVLVADNGRGIPAEFQEKIFDPFFTTKGESGTGLGLWVTSDIVRKYNGATRLRSTTRPGRSGTCFSVFFPFQASDD